MLPLPAAAPPDSVPTSLPYDTHVVTFRVLLTPLTPLQSQPPPPLPTSLSPRHYTSALLSTLSSRLVPSAQYPPHAPSLLTCDPPVSFRLPLAWAAVVFFASVFFFAAPALLHVSPTPFLILPPAPLPLLPP